ncbi:MAG: hypothetical protein HFJ58_06305 [Clostridia bacterium]|nr:hypothetical protein [Clostridia bacterium]
MKSMASYLLAIFMVMFWIFRIIVAFTASMGIDIGFVPMNMNMEIILLFVTIPCVILVVKRKLTGAIIYLITYGMYFGVDLYSIVTGIMAGTTTLVDYARAFVSFVGVVIPIAVFFNLLIDKNRMAHPVDKKTDWFYNNEEFDRKLDSRADKNQYKNY